MCTDWLLQAGRKRPAHADYLHLQQLPVTDYGKHQTGALLSTTTGVARRVFVRGVYCGNPGDAFTRSLCAQ